RRVEEADGLHAWQRFRLAVTAGVHMVCRCGNERGCCAVRWSHPIEDSSMLVLMIPEVPNLTEEMYGGMIGQLNADHASPPRLHRPLRRTEPVGWQGSHRDLGIRSRQRMVRRQG